MLPKQTMNEGNHPMLNYLIALQYVLRSRLEEEEGQGMVEYALIVGGISLVLVTAFITTGVGAAVTDLSTTIAAAITP